MFRSHFSYGNNLLPVPVSKKRKHFPFLCVINCTFKVFFFSLSSPCRILPVTFPVPVLLAVLLTKLLLSVFFLFGRFTEFLPVLATKFVY
jgi:hypothetical protein